MKLKTLIKSLRDFRVFHRWMGLTLALLLVISAVTGILLALKKEVDTIQPPTQKGVSKNLAEWKSLDELSAIAEKALHETRSGGTPYGPSHVAGLSGAGNLSTHETQLCLALGERIATLAHRLT